MAFADVGALWKVGSCPCETLRPEKKVTAQIAARAAMFRVNRRK